MKGENEAEMDRMGKGERRQPDRVEWRERRKRKRKRENRRRLGTRTGGRKGGKNSEEDEKIGKKREKEGG